MQTPDTPTRVPPLRASTTSAAGDDAKLEQARRFLASRGITDVRPVYGARARPTSLNARLQSARDVRRAANDAVTRTHGARDGSAV